MNIEALERACLKAWPARVRTTRYGWEYCATDGRSGRANCIWPLAWTDEAPLGVAIADAAAWCAAHGVSPMFKLTEGATAPPELWAALTAEGYVPHTPTLLMTGPIGAGNKQVSSIELHGTLAADFEAPLRESAPDPDDAAERLAIVARIPALRVFALARVDGAPAAIGMGVLSGDLLGIYLMRTAPRARRLGLARQLFKALLHWGEERSATTAYLQVEESNEAAVALYAAHGFVTTTRYTYWSRR